SDGLGPGVGTFFYHHNLINSSAVVTDANGIEVSRMVYLPFGELAQDNSVGNDVVTDKYTGQESDGETGLYYYNARYYDPMVGRFLSADPIVANAFDGQAFNRYTYTRNNPITSTDPSGLCPPNTPTSLCYGTPDDSGGWLGSLIGAAGWLFGFSWLGGGSRNNGPSGPKPWTPPHIAPGTPSTPLQVDQSSSGNPNGTLNRGLTINEI